MKRYFDLHDKRQTVALAYNPKSEVASAGVEELQGYFDSEDVRELTLSQYRRVTVQYEDR